MKQSCLGWGLWLLCAMLSIVAFAEETTDAETKLEAVEEHITRMRERMQDTQAKYEQSQSKLKQTEKAIGALAKSLNTLAATLKEKEQALKTLEKRQSAHEVALKTQREQLAEQIRASYVIGRQDYLKILLNQEDPVSIGRLLTYYDYFNQARVAQIDQISETLEQLQIVAAEIQQEKALADELLVLRRDKKTQLEARSKERRVLVANLSDTLNNQGDALKRLNDSRTRLQKVLELTGGVFIDVPAGEFAKFKGRLPWPVVGTLRENYGDERGVGSLTWQGVLIEAKAGEKIRTVADGQVVFADWMRNLGQLLIVRHDENYMSLYAHNRSLLKNVGDTVKAGDIIADVGNSGGHEEPGLYFEIRHEGKPVDPSSWLVGR